MKLDPAAPLKDPEGLHDRRQAGPPARHSGQGLRQLRLRAGRQAAGHAARAHGASGGRASATLLSSVNDDACRKIPGYLRAVRKGDFLAVVASNEWAAIRASTTIDAKWSDWAGLPEQVRAASNTSANRRSDRDRGAAQRGRSADALPSAGKTLAGHLRHAATTRTARSARRARWPSFKDGQLTVWTPSQASHLLRSNSPRCCGLSRGQAACIYVEGAGCYGRNGADDCSSEAALIAMEIGQPVRLQWMREDEHGWDPKGPPTLLDYRAAYRCPGTHRRLERRHLSARTADATAPASTLLAAMLADLPKFGPAHESGTLQARPRPALHAAVQPADRALAGRHAAAGGVDPRAGAHAEHLRQRELSRRDRRG